MFITFVLYFRFFYVNVAPLAAPSPYGRFCSITCFL